MDRIGYIRYDVEGELIIIPEYKIKEFDHLNNSRCINVINVINKQ